MIVSYPDGKSVSRNSGFKAQSGETGKSRCQTSANSARNRSETDEPFEQYSKVHSRQNGTGSTPSHCKASTAWKEIMMRRVCDVDLTVVNSELEAFVLETNLIKQFRPKFNIMMKDDKNYVYVKITMQDRFPRIDVVRQMENDGSKYFGPKTSADLVRKNLSFLRSIFPFRTCKMEIEIQKAEGSSQKAENSDQLPLDVICTHRDRPTPCLDYHIKQCSAPCIGTCTPEQYRQDCIDGVIDFFEGKYRDIEVRLKEQMTKAAQEKKFERAAQLRDHFLYIQELQAKQIVSDTSGENTDCIPEA
jgi:excinuclease ABC subunit C